MAPSPLRLGSLLVAAALVTVVFVPVPTSAAVTPVRVVDDDCGDAFVADPQDQRQPNGITQQEVEAGGNTLVDEGDTDIDDVEFAYDSELGLLFVTLELCEPLPSRERTSNSFTWLQKKKGWIVNWTGPAGEPWGIHIWPTGGISDMTAPGDSPEFSFKLCNGAQGTFNGQRVPDNTGNDLSMDQTSLSHIAPDRQSFTMAIPAITIWMGFKSGDLTDINVTGGQYAAVEPETQVPSDPVNDPPQPLSWLVGIPDSCSNDLQVFDRAPDVGGGKPFFVEGREINQVEGAGIELSTPDTSKPAPRSTEVTYELDFKNTVTENRTVTLETTAPDAWNPTFHPAAGLEIAANKTASTELTLSIPTDAPLGRTRFQVTANAFNTTFGLPAPKGDVTLDFVAKVDPSPFDLGTRVGTVGAAVAPGDSTTYEMVVDNPGRGEHSYELDLDGQHTEWGQLSSTFLALDPGESRTVGLEVTVPENPRAREVTHRVEITSLQEEGLSRTETFTTQVGSSSQTGDTDDGAVALEDIRALSAAGAALGVSPWFVVIGALLILLLLVLLVVGARRRRERRFYGVDEDES